MTTVIAIIIWGFCYHFKLLFGYNSCWRIIDSNWTTTCTCLLVLQLPWPRQLAFDFDLPKILSQACNCICCLRVWTWPAPLSLIINANNSLTYKLCKLVRFLSAGRSVLPLRLLVPFPSYVWAANYTLWLLAACNRKWQQLAFHLFCCYFISTTH